MPGRYMAKEVDGFNPGKGYLRIAIDDDKEVVEDAMKRISLFLKSIPALAFVMASCCIFNLASLPFAESRPIIALSDAILEI